MDFKDELKDVIDWVFSAGVAYGNGMAKGGKDPRKEAMSKHEALIKQHRPKKREIKIQDSYSTKAARKEGYNTALDDYSNSLGIEE